MLKIVDDVDLKELEKFGFETIELNGEILSYKKSFKEPFYNSTDVCPANRRITYFERPNLDTIYDLIKADLVEKV